MNLIAFEVMFALYQEGEEKETLTVVAIGFFSVLGQKLLEEFYYFPLRAFYGMFPCLLFFFFGREA